MFLSCPLKLSSEGLCYILADTVTFYTINTMINSNELHHTTTPAPPTEQIKAIMSENKSFSSSSAVPRSGIECNRITRFYTILLTLIL